MNNVCKTLLMICSMIVAVPGFGEAPEDVAFGGAYVTFSGKFGGEVSLDDLKDHEKIEIAGCAAGSRVLGFTLIIRSGKRQMEFVGESGKLTGEMLKALRELYSGDTFIFRDMQAKLPNGGTVDVWGKLFTVTGGPQRS